MGSIQFILDKETRLLRRASSRAWSVWTSTWHEDVGKLIPKIWQPFIHNVSDPHFVTDGGKEYNIPKENHRWNIVPDRKKILIIDIDSRLDVSRGAILSEKPLAIESIKGRAAGLLNHFLYANTSVLAAAMIHGYDYRLVRPPNYDDRHGTWVKVPIIREALKTHDIVVFLDADAVFQQMHLPLEWLLSLWNVRPETLVAMSEDPNSPVNRDDKGWVLWNTGFIIAQQSERTQELFNKWEDCPTGRHHPKCTHWAYSWAHEQAAFGAYIRYEYNTTDDFAVIPCMDGNGGPRGGPHCQGIFVRHHWFDKHAPVDELYAMLSDQLVQRLHRHFLDHKDKFFLDVSHMSHPLDNLVI
ncbi:hypothetical protein HJFPF1_02117 [Paramyrothecium foliicola]|nr:hypothetical protein HJFPF1_02117 [Paramyrothecium foliicola]